ncbi:MAG: FAD-dependent oxidoreductase [Oscillospiraceae bacterium]|jgi:NAD(P)H-nitrite reductase large subunit|nr:FAD-dependent oxidoreductase [Oscillospiraceae bacterium]
MTHVIIGSGAAGMAAAGTIREIDPAAQITIISGDDAIYSRCLLHHYISGDRAGDKMSFVQDGFFDKYGVGWITGQTVTAIDTENKYVAYGDARVNYDRLLIATGSNSSIPPVGALREAQNVYGLRHLSDAAAIRAKAGESKRAAVIGAGLVGLDAAYSLIHAGQKVHVVELEDRILALNLDSYAAEQYQKRFEDAGCLFTLGQKAVDTVCTDGAVTALVLENGESIGCDMVIVAAGVRPAVGFLEGSGVRVDRFVVVDGHMKTSARDVYAAGDVTGLSGIWPNAVVQGTIAARNMCGGEEVYSDTFAAKNTVNFFGLATLSVGKTEPDENDSVEILEDRNVYKKAVITGDTVSGVILQGDISNSGHWQHIVKNKIPINAARRKADRSVFKTTFADYYGIDTDGSYIWA